MSTSTKYMIGGISWTIGTIVFIVAVLTSKEQSGKQCQENTQHVLDIVSDAGEPDLSITIEDCIALEDEFYNDQLDDGGIKDKEDAQ